MKFLLALLIVSSSILTSTQLLAHGLYWKSATGTFVTDSAGNCVMTGVQIPDGQPCGSMSHKHDNMAKMPHKHEQKAMTSESKSMSDEPVIEEVINLKGVTFKTGSDELNSSSNIRLNISAKDLIRNPNLQVTVAGHTDNVGDPAFNKALSQKRAEAVEAYLIGRGVDASRLSAEGFGDSQPAASNDTAEGRAKNRRVELRIH